MPEGPSIVILKEQVTPFLGHTIRRVQGNTTIGKERLLGQRVESFRSWGKRFLVELPDFALRVHFLLFGSYRINEAKSWAQPRLHLGFDVGEINAAGGEAARARARGAAVQLRLLRMEEGVRAEEALAGAHEEDVPALPDSAGEGAPGADAEAEFLVRGVPGDV